MSKTGNDRFDDDSDEEFANGDQGSSKWSVSGASSSSSASPSLSEAAEPKETPETVVVQERQEDNATRELATSSTTDSSPVSIAHPLEPSLVEYLVEHRDHITLDSIKATHDLLSELGQSQPNKSVGEHLSDLKRKYYTPESVASESDACEELSSAKQTIQRLELKLKLLDQRLKEELSCSNELKVHDIFKNSGALDYMESQKKSIKIKNDMIAELKSETERLKKEKLELRDQCKRASELNEHYCRLLRDAESQQGPRHVGLPISSRDQSLNQERILNDSSPAASFDECRVPPPPPIEVPSIDEMLRMATSPAGLNQSRQPQHDSRLYTSTDNSIHYNGMDMSDNSIPPPPLEHADLDEIFREMSFGSQRGGQQRQPPPPHSQSMNSMCNIPSRFSNT